MRQEVKRRECSWRPEEDSLSVQAGGRREWPVMLHQTSKNRRVTNGSSKMEFIGDLAKSQFSGAMGGESGEGANRDSCTHRR